jgi:hypothetical protein
MSDLKISLGLEMNECEQASLLFSTGPDTVDDKGRVGPGQGHSAYQAREVHYASGL